MKFFQRNKQALGSRAAKVGGYSFVISVIVLAILIAVNVAVSCLPSTWTSFDISSARLYSVTTATKAVAQNLDEDVTIYWITQAGQEDSVTQKLLGVYDALSDHIEVVKKNPDEYPTFAAQYTDETVQNNSLVVECGDRFRYIPYEDIYEADTSSYYTTGSVSYSYDGESCITTAIDYVTAEELPKLYILTGHDETDLSESFTDAIEKQNIETEQFSLLNTDAVPEDAAAILINAPKSDISEDEETLLEEYLDNGGKLIVLSGPEEDDTMDHLHGLLTKYGIEAQEGIVIEGSRSNYALSYPYYLLPNLGDSEITSELSENNSYIIVPVAQGLTVGTAPSGVTVTSLLDTTEESFSKTAGYSITTYDKEEGDVDGPFSVAVTVNDSGTGAQMVWIASDNVMTDDCVSMSSGANSDFTMNALSWLIGEDSSIAIRSKSLDYSTLTISTSQANVIKVCLIAIIPLVFIVAGAEDVLVRRKKA